jgi:hypothetical protein
MVDLSKYNITQIEYDFLVALKKGSAFQFLAEKGYQLSKEQLLRIAKELVAETDDYITRFEDPDMDSIVEYILQDWDDENQEELQELINKQAEAEKEV